MCEPNAHCQNNSQIHVNTLLFNLVWTKPRLIPSPDTADVLRTTIGFDTLCTVTHSSLLIRTTAYYEGGSHLWFFSLPRCCITSEHLSPAETKSYLSKNWYLFGYKRSNCCWKLWYIYIFLKWLMFQMKTYGAKRAWRYAHFSVRNTRLSVQEQFSLVSIPLVSANLIFFFTTTAP